MGRKLSFLAILPLMLFTMGNQSCQVRTPEEIRIAADQNIHPFFPNAVTYVFPAQESIISYTCTTGAGREFLVQVEKLIPTFGGIKQLRELRSLAGFAQTYRYFELAFEQGIIVYDIDTNQTSFRRPNGPNYLGDYQQVCGMHQTVVGSDGDNQVMSFFGVWEISVHGEVKRTIDSLGMYRIYEFDRFKNREVAAREAILTSVYKDRGTPIDSIKLVEIRAIPMNRSDIEKALPVTF